MNAGFYGPPGIAADPMSYLPSAKDIEDVWSKPRDWRYRVVPIYRIHYGSDAGFVLGGGLTAEQTAFFFNADFSY